MSVNLANRFLGRPAAVTAVPSRQLATQRFVGNNTLSQTTMKSRTCLVEVVPADSEPVEVTFKKFSSAVRRTGMYFEVRRRQRFECKQDRIKRKRKERPIKKRIRYIPTYARTMDTGLTVPPFADMFDNPDDDIFSKRDFYKSSNGRGRGRGRGGRFNQPRQQAASVARDQTPDVSEESDAASSETDE